MLTRFLVVATLVAAVVLVYNEHSQSNQLAQQAGVATTSTR
jgi:hypothetical protein